MPSTATSGGPERSLDALGLQRQHRSVEADPESDPRCRPTTEQLGQAVVSSAAADGVLLALAPGDEELERRARVVVEAAHQPMVDDVAHAHRVEQVEHGAEVRAAVVAQVVAALRGAVGQLGSQVLVVEDAQRVDLETPAGVIGQAVEVGAEVLDERFAVARAAGRVTDGVHVRDDIGQPDLGVEARARAR